MRVGPFNWTFAGKLSQINVYNQDSKEVGEKLFSSYYGSEERFFGIGDIKSGSDFYISVPLDGSTTKITKISGKFKRSVKCVDISFLESHYGPYQNLLHREL